MLTIIHVKGISFFIIACTPIIAFKNKDKNLNLPKPKNKSSQKKEKIISYICIILILLCVFSCSFYKDDLYKNSYSDIKNVEDNVITYMDNNNLSKNNALIYVGYNDGGHLEYYGLKPYIDARAELFLKKNNKQKDIFEEYFNIGIGEIDYAKFVESYNFDFLILNKNTDGAFISYLHSKSNILSYSKIYVNDSYELWTKKELL